MAFFGTAASRVASGLLLVSAAVPVHAYDWIHDWPTHYVFSDGTDFGLVFAYRYDVNTFSHDAEADGSNAFEDSSTNRRKELGLFMRKKDVYDAIVDYEFESKSWLDTALRVQSKALFGRDFGAFRFGYTKTPVSFEGATSTKATSFLELSLPAQAIFEGRRTGLDWAFERPRYIVNLGYYWADLQGDNQGTTLGGRVAWTPRKAAGDVLHLGVSASRENRGGSWDDGTYTGPTARIRTPPEAGLTPVRLVDTGTLSSTQQVRRSGLEGLWIGGPWSVQGELLRVDIERKNGKPDFRGDGAYLYGSWIATGESRPYSNGYTGNVVPKSAWGAWEFLVRYSEIDLNDGIVQGGTERDWTIGANWYLTEHLKFQTNYIWASSDKAGVPLDPQIFEARIQIYF